MPPSFQLLTKDSSIYRSINMYRKQLLFVCSRNQWRSPTAEALFKDSDLYTAKSAGTSDKARVKITPGLINWADFIFVMEKRHAAIIQRNYADLLVDPKLIILYIGDDYQYMDPELIDILESRLAEYLDLDFGLRSNYTDRKMTEYG